MQRERDSGSLTLSAVTYGDKSDVKLMIGDDGERERKRERDCREERNEPTPTMISCRHRSDRQMYMLWTE